MTAEAAAALSARGWYVFPVLPNGKKSAINDWPNNASADPAKVRRNWLADHNIGIATGPSGLVVVDLDRGKPLPPPWDTEPGVVDGADVWAVLRERHDPTWPTWLSTYTVATPSGGLHLYFSNPAADPSLGDTHFELNRGTGETVFHPKRYRNTASLIGPMIDTRADGGYVVAAGSIVHGKSYEVLEDGNPQWVPGWLSKLLTAAPPERASTKPPTLARQPRQPDKYINAALEREIGAVAGAWEGSRNNQLNKSAYALARFVADGKLDRDLAIAALSRAAETCGLGTIEITRTLRSAFAARGAAV